MRQVADGKRWMRRVSRCACVFSDSENGRKGHVDKGASAGYKFGAVAMRHAVQRKILMQNDGCTHFLIVRDEERERRGSGTRVNKHKRAVLLASPPWEVAVRMYQYSCKLGLRRQWEGKDITMVNRTLCQIQSPRLKA